MFSIKKLYDVPPYDKRIFSLKSLTLDFMVTALTLTVEIVTILDMAFGTGVEVANKDIMLTDYYKIIFITN